MFTSVSVLKTDHGWVVVVEENGKSVRDMFETEQGATGFADSQRARLGFPLSTEIALADEPHST